MGCSRTAAVTFGLAERFARSTRQPEDRDRWWLRTGIAQAAESDSTSARVPFILDIGTKGGIIFYSVVGIVLPFIVYNLLLDNGVDVVTAGNIVLVGYVGVGIVAWTGSYVFRVANKDMTYAQQLRDYENAVIQKRFEELSGEEVDALMGEIYPEKPKPPPS